MAASHSVKGNNELVLVTGGSGFIGLHCILALLNANYRVRTTIRSAKRQQDVLSMLKSSTSPTVSETQLSNLTFAVTDLLNDDGWADAVRDCVYVLHVASPFPDTIPKDENDLIKPAREGTFRVLKFSRGAGTVKRVVVTSSFAAIGHGTPPDGKIYDETSWTPTDGSHPISSYVKSKTLAERTAWEFIEKEGRGMELSVVNPVGVFGPVLGTDYATSIILVQRLLNGDLPGLPDIEVAIVDVRDVATLHLLAMTHPSAAGERFLAVAPPPLTFHECSLALKERMGAKAKNSPTRKIPGFVLRLVAIWDKQAAMIVPDLGVRKLLSNEKSRRVLGWSPQYSNKDALEASGESLVRFGVIKGIS
jgi:nucleoside-diphosphate-sugar epimerase